MALINCPECGREVSDKSKSCPHCGCPLVEEDQQNIQNVSVSKIGLLDDEKTKLKVKKIAIALAVVVIAIVGITAISKGSAKNNWKSNYDSAVVTMLNGAADAENTCNMIKSVWYNTIYKKKDSKTDKYCLKSGSSYTFNDDFNISLAAYFLSSEYTAVEKSIKTNREKVDSLMAALRNPPKEYEEAYGLIKDLYDTYYDMVECALNPTGSYSSYSSRFNDADDACSKAYNKAKNYSFN